MRAIAAAWGYLGDGSPPEQWHADALAHSPTDIRPPDRLGLMSCTRKSSIIASTIFRGDEAMTIPGFGDSVEITNAEYAHSSSS